MQAATHSSQFSAVGIYCQIGFKIKGYYNESKVLLSLGVNNLYLQLIVA